MVNTVRIHNGERISEILIRLFQGEKLATDELLLKYNVQERSLRRDLQKIRNMLSEVDAGRLVNRDGELHLERPTREDDLNSVLAASHIIIGSRAFQTAEMEQVLSVLRSEFAAEDQLALKAKLKEARSGYTELASAQPLLANMARVATCIERRQRMMFQYHSSSNERRIHHGRPVALFFENHYFYAVMDSVEHGGFWHYRLDRIQAIELIKRPVRQDAPERYSVRDHRKQTYLLDMGQLTKITFIYRNYPQTALDALPQTHIVRYNADGSVVISGYVKEGGALLWLLSQGAGVQVLEPQSLIDKLTGQLTAAMEQYR